MQRMTVENPNSSNGWLKKLSGIDFYSLEFKEYPNWELFNGKTPYFLMMERIHKKDKSSNELDSMFDDIAKGAFFSRDWTKDGLPFVNEGDKYWCGYWFQYQEDAKKFVELYGGIGNWMDGYTEFCEKCNKERDN